MQLFVVLFGVLFLFSTLVTKSFAFDIHITLQSDPHITPTQSELVTFGIPFPPGLISDASLLQVYHQDQLMPRSSRTGLRWHWLDNSIRSLIVQVDQIDMTQGPVRLKLKLSDSSVAEHLIRLEKHHQVGWSKNDPVNSNVYHPRIYALHEPEYLASTLLIPPYQPVTEANHITTFMEGQFANWAGKLNYANSRGADWLFDRSSAFFKVYMATGELKYLREAFMSKQFYFQYVRNDGELPGKKGGSGCWTYKTVACADGKYIYTQPAKLALALSGDVSQWDNQLILNMALQADLGARQPNTRQRLYRENQPFTERAAGLVGLNEVHAFEVTEEERLLYHLNERIEYLYEMQNEEYRWERFNNWLPKSGAFVHAWSVHEGQEREAQAATGEANNRRFSPWMSENIADFLWHSYQITKSERIPYMLKRLGNAIDMHGFSSEYESGEGLAAVYNQRFQAENKRACSGPFDVATDLLYSASPFASVGAMKIAHEQYHWTDKHNIQIVLPLALAYHFSDHSEDKIRLKARIEQIIAQWTKNTKQDCSKVFGRTYRMWNWQHRSNALGTWLWANSQSVITGSP